MKIQHSVLICLPVLLLLSTVAQAQTQDRTAVVGSTNRGSELLSPEAVEDLGQLQEATPFQPTFGLNASTQFMVVTNALQQGKNSSADFLFFPAVNATFLQPLPAGFSIDAMVQLNTVIYSRYSNLNFWGPNGAAHLNWQYKPWLPQIYFGTEPYYYQNYQTFGANANVTAATTITTGIAQSFDLGKDGRTQLGLGYKFSEYYANPSTFTRSGNLATVSITRNLAPGLSGQVYYGYQYSYYGNAQLDPSTFNIINRQDSQNIVGVSLTKHFNKNLTGTLSGSWVDNISTLSGYSYQNFVVSIGLNWQFF